LEENITSQKMNFCRRLPRNHSLGRETFVEPCFILKHEWKSFKNREIIVNAFLFLLRDYSSIFVECCCPAWCNKS
uniref:Uncharacterized protein n=1 Tax=Spermophilus dauricus TaxID=99837 RepID=A0A8C9P5C6_SPEDA